MNKWFLLLAIVTFGINLNAQKYYTKEGKISFYSDAPLERIEAHNNKATAVMDMTTGRIEWAVLIKAFLFEKALMQEHFNENYMESTKYPKATFQGQFLDWTAIDLSKEGEKTFDLQGKLTVHGVSKEIMTPATLIVKDGVITGKSIIKIEVADYKISIPGVVRDKIAKEVEVNIEAQFQPLKSKS